MLCNFNQVLGYLHHPSISLAVCLFVHFFQLCDEFSRENYSVDQDGNLCRLIRCKCSGQCGCTKSSTYCLSAFTLQPRWRRHRVERLQWGLYGSQSWECWYLALYRKSLPTFALQPCSWKGGWSTSNMAFPGCLFETKNSRLYCRLESGLQNLGAWYAHYCLRCITRVFILTDETQWNSYHC